MVVVAVVVGIGGDDDGVVGLDVGAVAADEADMEAVIAKGAALELAIEKASPQTSVDTD